MDVYIIDLDVDTFHPINQQQIESIVSFAKSLEENDKNIPASGLLLVKENTFSSLIASRAISELIPLITVIKDRGYWTKNDDSYRLSALAKNIVYSGQKGLKVFIAVCEKNDSLIKFLPKYLAKELGLKYETVDASHHDSIAQIAIKNDCREPVLQTSYCYPPLQQV